MLLVVATGLALPALSPVLPAMPSWLALAVAASLGVGIFLPARARVKLLSAFLTALYWSLGMVHAHLEDRLPLTLDGCDWRLTGEIIGLPLLAEGNQRFEFRVQEGALLRCPNAQMLIAEGGYGFPDRIRLRLYGGSFVLKPGQRLVLRARLWAPRGRVNPGGSDYEAYLLARSYAATGYVRTIERLGTAWGLSFAALRFQVSATIDAISSLKQAAIMQTLLIGDRRKVTAEQWRILQRTGTVHLLVVSGLHIGFASLFGAVLGAALWLCVRRGMRVRWAAAGAILAALLYSGMAGFQMATIRAVAAVTVFSLASLLARHIPMQTRFLLSLCTVLFLDPLAPLETGFWLSFGAVAAILLVFLRRYPGKPGRLHQLLRIQLSIALLMTPLLLLFLGEASLWGPLINLFAVPWVGFVALPALLLSAFVAVIGSWDGAWALGDAALHLLWLVLQWFALLPGGGTFLGGGSLTWLSLFGALLLLLPLGAWLRKAALLLWLCGILRLSIADSQTQLWVLDVGQGLSALIRVGNQAVVYDTGPAYPGGYDAVRDTLLPALRALGVTRAPIAVISHGDADHAGALSTLRTAFPGMEVISGEPARLLHTGPVSSCERRNWEIEGVRFEVRMPAFKALLANDRSCTLHVAGEGWSLLLAGDLSVRSERVWLAQPGLRRANVLVAPHHGSAGSSGAALLAAVAPNWVVYSSGWRNRFGHPRDSTCARARRQGASLLSTARHGALRFDMHAGERPVGTLWRCTAPPWWRQIEPVDCLRADSQPLGLINPCP